LPVPDGDNDVIYLTSSFKIESRNIVCSDVLGIIVLTSFELKLLNEKFLSGSINDKYFPLFLIFKIPLYYLQSISLFKIK